jgi:hypothetical protein
MSRCGFILLRRTYVEFKSLMGRRLEIMLKTMAKAASSRRTPKEEILTPPKEELLTPGT